MSARSVNSASNRKDAQSLGAGTEEAMSRTCLHIVDAGLAGVVFLAPMFMGGRHPLGQLVFVLLVCSIATAWAVRQCLTPRAAWRPSGAELLICGGLLLLFLQLLPLPQSLLLRLSPALGEYLPLWIATVSGSLGTWSQISLSPQATRGGLVMYLAYAMLFVVVVQRLHTLHDIERLLRWIALAAVVMGLVGLVQFLLGNGKFLWIYEHPSRHTANVVKGMFANQNHFAHFLALGIGPLIWWMVRILSTEKKRRSSKFSHSSGNRDRDQYGKVGIALAFGVIAFAGLLTFSRGGVVAMFVATAVCVGIYAARGLLGKKALVSLGAAGLVVGAALFIYGYEPLAQRLETVADAGSVEELSSARWKLWGAMGSAFSQFPVLGSGVGSHREVYPMFLQEYFAIEFTHGENGYLQTLLETGIVGFGLLLTGIGLVLYWCVFSLARSGSKEILAAAGAILAAVAASLVHAFVDFAWYLPACMSLTVILVACGCRIYQIHVAHSHKAATLDSDPHKPEAQARNPENRRGNNLNSRLSLLCREWGKGLGELKQSVFASLALVCPSPWGNLSLGTGTSRLGEPKAPEKALPRVAWVVAAVAVAAISLAMIQDRRGPARAAPHWDKYLAVAYDVKQTNALFDPEEAESVVRMEEHLEQVLKRNPNDPRANLRMANLCLRRFELEQKNSPNPMPLNQIRDAALASSFPSREALDQWLSRAIGSHHTYLDRALFHALRALQLCPLQGEAYISLAELVFLEGKGPEVKSRYIDQALRVRPHHGTVLVAAGGEAILEGDQLRAMELWKKAFHQDPEHQVRLIELLAPQLPALLFIEQFEPDRLALARLYAHYRETGQMDKARDMGPHYAKSLQDSAAEKTGLEAARLWNRAGRVHQFLDHDTEALNCAREAVRQASDDLTMRGSLARQLLRANQWDEAIEQFQWCLHRRPEDADFQQGLVAARRGQLEQRETAERTIGDRRSESR